MSDEWDFDAKIDTIGLTDETLKNLRSAGASTLSDVVRIAKVHDDDMVFILACTSVDRAILKSVIDDGKRIRPPKFGPIMVGRVRAPLAEFDDRKQAIKMAAALGELRGTIKVRSVDLSGRGISTNAAKELIEIIDRGLAPYSDDQEAP